VHHGRVVFAGEDVSGAAHVGRELIHFVDSLDGIARNLLIAKVAYMNSSAGGSANSWRFRSTTRTQ